MRIIITRDTVADGRPVFVDETVDVKPETAQLLIQMGKARIAPDARRIETAEALPEEAAVALRRPRKGKE